MIGTVGERERERERERRKSMLSARIDDPIYPTPLLGQDMTQDQFLSGV